MTLIELYQSQGKEGQNGENSRALLAQTHWFTVNSEFDPKTGEALPQALSAFLAKVAWSASAGTRCHDRLWRITEHARPSVKRLFRALSESPRREQALLPVHAVRELDANSFIKLSNRPGRNIREKLAGKPYLQAVRRYQSVNIPENRLLKAFVTRLEELLELRQDCLGEVEDDLLSKIQLWLRSSDAHAIARWDNLPPNNTLLSHRDYRRVWDAWRGLQTLDDDIARDFSQLEVRAKTMQLWNKYGQMYFEGAHLFAEMPVLFDYEKFEISPWHSRLRFQEVTRKIARFTGTDEIFDPVCIDLAVLRPRYATTKASSQTLCETYLWQQWNNDEESVDIDLFNSDAAFLHPDATSLSSTDLFFPKDNTTEENLDRAARAFSSRLREIFKNDVLIWLIPDYLNDFDLGLGITRRNINARFPNAEPLPRSVATVIEKVDYSQINNDGFAIVVVDTIGDKTCVTKLIARFDSDLKKRLPDTNGYYWERCPPVIILNREKKGNNSGNYDIITVDEEGRWIDRIRTEKPQDSDPTALRRDPRIGQFAYCINLANSPVTGGIRLHALQQFAGDIALWRDQIPELSIKVKMRKDGPYQRFHLVSRGTTVQPIRGLPVPIPVHKNFTLPAAGKENYKFPLFIGENAEELGFSARLDSTAFPLKSDSVCKLSLTFEYGADEPYKLIFTPLDNSFSPVRATWRRTEEDIITDAPAPEYPESLSWADLHLYRNAQGNEDDLLEWLIDASTRLLELIPNRCIITITSPWRNKIDKIGNDYWFCFAETSDGEECYCNTKNFVNNYTGNPNDDFSIGMDIHCNIYATTGGLSAFYISKEHNAASRLVKDIRKSLYVPFINIWKDGRSTTDNKCPNSFANAAKNCIEEIDDLLRQDEIPQSIKYEFLFLLSCLHKDTTEDCIEWITYQAEQLAGQAESVTISDPRAVGFALGDLSEMWQLYIFSIFFPQPNSSVISVFAYAIWREQHFVDKFTITNLNSLLITLLQRLSDIRPIKAQGGQKKDKWTIRNWVRATAEPLELLLGLLRTRASTNQKIKMLLQPHQEITKELAKQVDRVTEIVAQSKVTLFSRVQLNISKPDGDRTPDLLYALRLYLSGDDGANAIHITSVSDNDSD